MSEMVGNITATVSVKIKNAKSTKIGISLISFVAKLFKISVEFDVSTEWDK